jgi:hypothetical protein
MTCAAVFLLILTAPALYLIVLTVSDLRQSPALLCWLCHVILLIWDRVLEMLCSSYIEIPWNLREMIKIYALYACLFDMEI